MPGHYECRIRTIKGCSARKGIMMMPCWLLSRLSAWLMAMSRCTQGIRNTPACVLSAASRRHLQAVQCNRFVGWDFGPGGQSGQNGEKCANADDKAARSACLWLLLGCWAAGLPGCWAAEMSFLERPHRIPHPQHALWGCGKREDDAWARAAPANSMSSGGHQTRPFRVQLCQSRNGIP